MHTDEYLADSRKLGKKLLTAKNVIVIIALIAWYFGFFVDKTFTLNASTSELEFLELGLEADKFGAKGIIKIIYEEINVNVPTSAYIGIVNAQKPGSSVQLFLTRESRKNQFYTAGYRVIENDEEVLYKKITEVPLNSNAEILFEYSNGFVKMDINHQGLIKENADFKSIIPFVAATSGQVRYRFSDLDVKFK